MILRNGTGLRAQHTRVAVLMQIGSGAASVQNNLMQDICILNASAVNFGDSQTIVSSTVPGASGIRCDGTTAQFSDHDALVTAGNDVPVDGRP